LNDLTGRVVFSKSGRDKDRMFVIVKSINDKLVLITDGDMRKIENPKVKNLKHLSLTVLYATEVKAYLDKGEIPGNNIIKKELKRIQEARELNGKGV